MQRSTTGKGIGCLAILPAAFIGLSGLTDGIGPTGWRGFTELFGWVAICVVASYCLGLLFTPRGWRNAWRYVAGVALTGALIWTFNWLGLDAPMTAKVAFTSSLQIFGVIAGACCLLALAYFARGTSWAVLRAASRRALTPAVHRSLVRKLTIPSTKTNVSFQAASAATPNGRNWGAIRPVSYQHPRRLFARK